MSNFFDSQLFAVVGASSDREKFGNKVLRCYQQNSYPVVPISKRQMSIENSTCLSTLSELCDGLAPPHSSTIDKISSQSQSDSTYDDRVKAVLVRIISPRDIGVSIITPQVVTTSILQEGYALGIRNFFLQPGTIEDSVLRPLLLEMPEANVIRGCVLVELGFPH